MCGIGREFGSHTRNADGADVGDVISYLCDSQV